MTTFLLFGLLAGLRHTFEADHLAAVAALSRADGLPAAVYRGLAWGLGHAVALLAFGGACLLLGRAVPAPLASGFEAGVGLLLVALGVDALRRLVARGRHAHAHRHDDGTHHAHPHDHDAAPDVHEHGHRFPGRVFAVGSMHGLAGSGALVVLVLGATSSISTGLLWVAVFGLGATGGMALASALFSAPLRMGAARVAGATSALELLVALATVAIGAQRVFEQLG